MRLREPAAWVALGALVLNLLLALVAMATFDGPLPSVAWVLSARPANPVPLVVLTVLVSFCVLRERTPHARQLTLISLVVGVIAVLLGLIFALLGFGATAPVVAVFAAIVTQAISVIAVGFLIKLLQLQAVPRRLPAGIGLAPYPSVALPTPPVTAPRPTPATNLAPGHRGRCSLAYGGRSGSRCPGGWLGGRPCSGLAADPHPTERPRSKRAAAGWAEIWRAAPQWAAIQCVRTLWAPSRSAGTARSDTKRRQNASANAGTGTNAEPAQDPQATRDNGIRSRQRWTGGAGRSLSQILRR